jgi:hypothetical protein
MASNAQQNIDVVMAVNHLGVCGTFGVTPEQLQGGGSVFAGVE